MMKKSRQYSEDEVRDILLKHFVGMCEYWEKECGIDTPLKRRLEGLCFCMLAALDGETGGMPRFIVAPDPHPKDKDYYKKNGMHWFPGNRKLQVNCDLSGTLHEHWHDAVKKYYGEK